MAQWYYAQQGKRLGPVSGEQLRELAQSGQIVPSDMVWRSGMEQWAPANSIKGLFPVNQEEGPPPIGGPPPLRSERAQQAMTQATKLTARAVAAVRDVPLPGGSVVRPEGDFWSRLFVFDAAMFAGAAILLLCATATWAEFGPLRVSGFDSHGKYAAALGAAVAWIAVIQVIGKQLRWWHPLAMRLCAFGAAGIGFWDLLDTFYAKSNIAHDAGPNEFTRMLSRGFAAALQPGLGMYLAILGGIVVLIVSFSPFLASKFPVCSVLMRPLRKPS